MFWLLLSLGRAEPTLVRYSVVVDGLAAFPEHVVVVYPWSNSNTESMDELVQLMDGRPLSFGRGTAGVPGFYALKRSALQSWAETPPRDVQALLASGQRCSGDISPRFAATSDPPGDIVDAFTLMSIDEQGCEIVGAVDASGSTGCQTAPGGLWSMLLLLLGLSPRRR